MLAATPIYFVLTTTLALSMMGKIRGPMLHQLFLDEHAGENNF